MKLPREFPELSKLVGSLIIGQLLTAAYSRDDTLEPDRRQFCLYCDEFQNFATPDFAQLFTQTGKYHLAPTVAHQERVGQFAEEKKILGATSAAPMKISFQTTVKDAEELAPEFARPPEAAWEEELEEEWVEVLQEEWTEKIEEKVIDGEEPIKTYNLEVIDYLFHRDHPDPRVMRFSTEYLRPTEPFMLARKTGSVRDYSQFGDIEADLKTLQNWLAEGMTNTTLLWQENRAEHIYPFLGMRSTGIGTDYKPANPFLGKPLEYLYPNLSGEESNTFSLYQTLLSPDDYILHPETVTEPYIQQEKLFELRDYLLAEWHLLNETLQQQAMNNLSMTEKDYEDLFTEYAQDFFTALSKTLSYWGSLSKTPLQTIFYPLHKFLKALRLCQLGLNQLPLYTTQSGQYQQRIRTQIHYITHPRQTITHPRIAIMHPQRTEADMVGEMRRELINLPRFTAYCKIVKEIAGTQHVVKYKLFPDAPESVADGAGSPEWKRAYIVERMHDETLGYYRKREAVEQEIAARRATLKARELRQKGQTTSDEDEE